MQQNSSLLFILFLFISIMAGEYVVYVMADPELLMEKGEKGVLVLLKLLGKGGGWCRIGFVFLFLLERS